MDNGGFTIDRKAFSGLHVLAQQKRRNIRAFVSEAEMKEKSTQQPTLVCFPPLFKLREKCKRMHDHWQCAVF
eukprot:4272278-Pleurochrysis_carterae.AAC.1